MSHRSMVLGAAFSVIALMALGCSLVGRVVDQVVDDATGGAVSTIESLQSEMGEALATLPAEIPGLPGEFPGESPLATEVEPATETEGNITGNLSYPSEGIPPLKVVAFDAESQTPIATVETEAGQSTYSLSVPIGAYYVVAYTHDGQLAGGYTLAVICGLSVDCTDHMLIPVGVAPGFAPEGIDPTDWYAPEGSFPPMP
jgi:hypothetical protein